MREILRFWTFMFLNCSCSNFFPNTAGSVPTKWRTDQELNPKNLEKTFFFYLKNKSFLIHPVSVPGWGLLDSPGKLPNSQNFSGVRSSSKFSTGETTKPTGDDMKIQRDELINTLLWLKNIHTWFTQKHINGWLAFNCQNILRKIALAMKTSLKN